MGLFDTLLGRTKPVRANLDALFALPSAAVTLQTAAGLISTGSAGVCWKPPAGQSAEDLEKEVGELLDLPDDESTATAVSAPAGPKTSVGTFTQSEDSYGYRWLLLQDPDIEDLVTRVHLANSTLTDGGWGPQLLCSVFGFTPQAGATPDARAFLLVYLYKRGTFYPFAPLPKERRDNELELRMQAVVGKDLPFEPDLSRWFPLWDAPVH
ncbi:MAG: PspA-associated protein PspAB [Acidimicrobiales bacterium]